MALAQDLERQLAPTPQAYGKLLRGELLLARRQPREALAVFKEAQRIADTWPGRFNLGRAYLELQAFPEAQSEFERCLKRRGEATAVFRDDVPSLRFLPPAHYYYGRADEGCAVRAPPWRTGRICRSGSARNRIRSPTTPESASRRSLRGESVRNT